MARWIMLPEGRGYCYGVEAAAVAGGVRGVELHGGFTTFEQADEERRRLLREFSDYAYAKVVKIETPSVEVREVVGTPNQAAAAERRWHGQSD